MKPEKKTALQDQWFHPLEDYAPPTADTQLLSAGGGGYETMGWKNQTHLSTKQKQQHSDEHSSMWLHPAVLR